MEITKFTCDKCGDLDSVVFSGYPFGDRLLEGVMFKAFFDNGGTLKVTLNDPSDKAYCSQLNMKYWYKEALDFAKKLDIAECPKCGEEVDGPGQDDDAPPPKTYPAKALSLEQWVEEAIDKRKDKK